MSKQGSSTGKYANSNLNAVLSKQGPPAGGGGPAFGGARTGFNGGMLVLSKVRSLILLAALGLL